MRTGPGSRAEGTVTSRKQVPGGELAGLRLGVGVGSVN